MQKVCVQYPVLPGAQQSHGEALHGSDRRVEGVLRRRDCPGGAAREADSCDQEREERLELSHSEQEQWRVALVVWLF